MPRQFTHLVFTLGVICTLFVTQLLLSNSTLLAEDKVTKDENVKKYHLHYQFKAGDFVHYQVSDSSSHTTQKNDYKEVAKSQSIALRHYRVVSVDDHGEAVLELMIDRVRMQAQFDDSDPSIFDSADPKLQPDHFKKILTTIGKPMSRMRVSRQGKLLTFYDLSGKDLATHNHETKKEPPSKNSSAKSDKDKKPKEENGIDQTPNFLIIFPKDPVAIDESWNQILTVEIPVTKKLKEKVQLLRKYKLVSIKQDIATISLDTVLITPVRDPAVKVRLLDYTPSGTIGFDMKRHLLISRKLKTDGQVIGAFGPGTRVKLVSIKIETIRPVQTAKRNK